MFQLTSQTIIQFASLIIYAALTSFVLYSRQVRPKGLFCAFLAAAAGASLVSLLVNLPLSYEWTALWKMLLLPFSVWAVAAYAHFVMSFLNRGTRRFYMLVYAWLAVTLVVSTSGYIAQEIAGLDSDFIVRHFGQVLSSLSITGELVAAFLVFYLISSLKNAADPEERNRIAYLLAGTGFMIAADIFSALVGETRYVLSHIGLTGNAVLVTYALLKYRLLDIQIVMKKWMVYTGVTVCITLAYLALLLGLSNMLRLLPPQLGIPAMIVMVVLFAYLFNWVKTALDKAADKLFYGSRYAHRQMLLSFASKMSNFINMKEIANALVGPLARAIQSEQVALLLPLNGRFSTQFVARLTDDKQIVPFVLQRSSVLTRWLERTGMPLLSEGLPDHDEFRQLSPEDRNALVMSRIEVLCPILSKHRLVGILALSRKKSHQHYTRDDIDLVIMLAKESAVAIENAQIYAAAKEKADTDELSGLRNHRYFQERLNSEVENSSISGEGFSLLFIDIDLFKTYNDLYGHVLGDEIIREFGSLIRASIRDRDIGARYGGDEFAVILLNTPVDSAQAVAERIRLKLEHLMDHRGIKLTCSIGIAGFGNDGVTRNQIVQAADEALYHAKNAGRNQVRLAAEADIKETAQPETRQRLENSGGVDSIVYALAATVDARDHYTYGHSKEVSRYATELAGAIGYPKDGIKRIQAAGLLHDIGKLNLPDNILTKRGTLTEEEWAAIRRHPEMGAGILKYIVGLRGCIDAVIFHHERYDGKGYPRGLKGKDIPLDARIMSISDAYDAMLSERGYKQNRMTEEEALSELKRCAGTQFDPELVEVFINLRRRSPLVPAGKDMSRSAPGR